ncbi:hypothetical protein VXP92_02875 [Acinetobacter baumannii]|uniref:hypothetical protein n=1 Tax=Acinetobacter baumannii TaxID=470 RepID=UPI003A8B1D05
MSEFKENKGIEGILKDVVKHGHGFAMVSIEGVEQVSIAHVINPFPCEELGDDSHIENRIGRIDKPSDSGELETLDKPENHISPNCEVRDA